MWKRAGLYWVRARGAMKLPLAPLLRLLLLFLLLLLLPTPAAPAAPLLNELTTPGTLAAKTAVLRLGVILPYRGCWPAGDVHGEAMLMALEAVNRRADILPTTELRFIAADGKCCATAEATSAMLRQLGLLNPAAATALGSPGIAGILGPLCSGGAAEVAVLAQKFNLAQVSSTATSVKLSDANAYPYFFRTSGADTAQVRVATVTTPAAAAAARRWRAPTIPKNTTESTRDITSREKHSTDTIPHAPT